MDLWNEVSKKLGLAFDATTKEASKLSDLAKAKYKLITAQNRRDGAFAAIGKLSYDEYKNNCDNKEAIAKLYEQIDILNELIHSLKDDIRKLRNKKICVSCGKAINVGDAFCPKCGAIQPQTEATAEAEEADESADEDIDDTDND